MMNGESGSRVTVQGGSAVAPPKSTLRDNIEKELAQLKDNVMSLSDRVGTLDSLLLNKEMPEEQAGAIDQSAYDTNPLLGQYASSILDANMNIARLTNTLDRIYNEHSLT